MELRVLEYFLAVATEGSISKAAEALHVSQPNISRQLQELEVELGKKLFMRGSRKVVLTEEGRLLRNRAQEILYLSNKAKTEINQLDTDISGDVYIGSAETEGMRFIAKAIKSLQTDYPQIRIHLYSGNAMDVLERLDNGLLDFGLVIGLSSEREYDVIHLPLKDSFGLLMRKDSPLASCTSICPDDLYGIPLLMSYSQTSRNAFSKWMGMPFEQLKIAASFNLIFNASIMVEEGVGYALTLEGLVKDNNVLCFRPLNPKLELGISLVRKKNQLLTRASEKFLAKLLEHL